MAFLFWGIALWRGRRSLGEIIRLAKEQEIVVALLVEIENQARHDERLAAPCCHVEEHMQKIGFVGKVVFIALEKARKGINLIGPQVVAQVNILRHTIRSFLFQEALAGN